MKNRIAYVVSFCILVSCLVIPAAFVLAQAKGGSDNRPSEPGGSNNEPKTFTLQNPLKVDSLGGLIQAFIEVFTYLVILFAVLAIIYVGLRYILARGNPEEMKKMSAWLLYIVIGVAVVIGARIIVSIVINTLGASGVVDPGVIQSAENAIRGK